MLWVKVPTLQMKPDVEAFRKNLMQQQMVWSAAAAAKRSRLNVKPTTVHTMTIANVQQQLLM